MRDPAFRRREEHIARLSGVESPSRWGKRLLLALGVLLVLILVLLGIARWKLGGQLADKQRLMRAFQKLAQTQEHGFASEIRLRELMGYLQADPAQVEVTLGLDEGAVSLLSGRFQLPLLNPDLQLTLSHLTDRTRHQYALSAALKTPKMTLGDANLYLDRETLRLAAPTLSNEGRMLNVSSDHVADILSAALQGWDSSLEAEEAAARGKTGAQALRSYLQLEEGVEWLKNLQNYTALLGILAESFNRMELTRNQGSDAQGWSYTLSFTAEDLGVFLEAVRDYMGDNALLSLLPVSLTQMAVEARAHVTRLELGVQMTQDLEITQLELLAESDGKLPVERLWASARLQAGPWPFDEAELKAVLEGDLTGSFELTRQAAQDDETIRDSLQWAWQMKERAGDGELAFGYDLKEKQADLTVRTDSQLQQLRGKLTRLDPGRSLEVDIERLHLERAATSKQAGYQLTLTGTLAIRPYAQSIEPAAVEYVWAGSDVKEWKRYYDGLKGMLGLRAVRSLLP